MTRTVTDYARLLGYGALDMTTSDAQSVGNSDEIERLKALNAELLAACQLAKARWDFVLKTFPNRTWKQGDQEVYKAVSKAIAKARNAKAKGV